MRRISLFAALLLPVSVLFFSAKPVDETRPPLSTHNPLMPATGEIFDFGRVNVDAIKSASMYTENQVTMLLSAIGGVDDTKRTFSNTMLQVDEIYNTLQKATSVYELISETNTDKEIRDLAGDMLTKFSTMTDELSQNENLYNAVKAYSETAEAKALSGERAFFVKRLLENFNLNGMALTSSNRDTLKSLNSRLNDLSVDFNKNLAGDKTTVSFKKEELQDLPDDFLKAHEVAGESGKYSFDLSVPTYNTFMTLCSNTESRKRMYLAKMNIGGKANEELLVKIFAIRQQKAHLLGFKTYSEYATADIMAKNTKNVWDFENNLAKDLRPKAQQDVNRLLAIKNKMLEHDKPSTVIYPYETAYYTTQLLKTEYNVDPEKVKEYFEIHNVIGGIFSVYQKLYNLTFTEDKNPSVWFKDVQAYTVTDNASGEQIGYFYLDLYPRPDKYNHFGCFSLIGSKTYAGGKKQMHSAALVCNFPPPTVDHPSLLPHTQVITFFHEFGHLIHTMLSNTELAYFAGTNVATDFVEAPSQIMENWAWQPEVLSLFAKHYKTGQPIPDSLVKRMVAARNVNSGVNTLQQVYYGTLDFTFNDKTQPKTAGELAKITADLQNQITLFPYVEGAHFSATFTHLTGYGSKYYGYLWSLVYASDMFSKFEEIGVLSPTAGDRYRQNVLAKGGSDEALSLVTNFLGRQPNNKAFLKQIGLE